MVDKITIRIVVIMVGLVTLLLIGGIVLLAAFERPAPTALETLAGTALGGLIGLLVSLRTTAAAPAPVAAPDVVDDDNRVPIGALDVGATVLELLAIVVVVVFAILGVVALLDGWRP